MHISKKKVLSVCSSVFVLTLILSMTVFAAEKAPKPQLYATFWALIPPVVAIALALITKEVYSSLFVGILVGALLYSGFSFEKTVVHIFEGGIISVLSDKYNVGILVFLVILGAMVSLMNRAGGSAAFGEWAGQHIKSRVGAQLATIALGVLIFIDDYFNCLTVGSVMRPVTDKHNVSRAKLSYLIDATAAPVCIIAPISSWAAAVTGFVEGEDGFSIFMQAIPYNFYALLTIVMMIGIVLLKADYGPMRTHEMNALKGDLYTTENRPYENVSEGVVNHNGKVIDLVIPILSLIVCCVIGMIYTGGFFDGVGFVEAFSNSDASVFSPLLADTGTISAKSYILRYASINVSTSSLFTISTLLITSTTGVFTFFNWSAMCFSPAPIKVDGSTSQSTTSTSFNVRSATFTIYSPSLFFALWIPGVSTKTI